MTHSEESNVTVLGNRKIEKFNLLTSRVTATGAAGEGGGGRRRPPARHAARPPVLNPRRQQVKPPAGQNVTALARLPYADVSAAPPAPRAASARAPTQLLVGPFEAAKNSITNVRDTVQNRQSCIANKVRTRAPVRMNTEIFRAFISTVVENGEPIESMYAARRGRGRPADVCFSSFRGKV
ncbi:hypothetical protein EVAR_81605_1 [Eumeta japonica]|uniref:Uncharacterized protein n=1 Tax=Eumeta variegata TaxID=151549 RepID=A0A4C1WFZ7_EUMVA|nr:hypothetical protein EVAR_81605_1 [Eumeta japonica]